MALPLSVSTTYVATTTPPIKAQDLNDLQKYLAGIYSCNYTIKALQVDGTGGNASTQTAGTLAVKPGTVAATPIILPNNINWANWWVDRNGFPMGHSALMREDWFETAGSASSTPTGAWFTVAANGAGAASMTLPSSTYFGRYWTVTPGTNANDYLNIKTNSDCFYISGPLDAVLEFHFQMVGIGANNLTWQLGMIGGTPTAGTGFTASNLGVWFEKASGNTNWQAVACDGGTKNVVDSGTAPVNTTWTRFRIELHGANGITSPTTTAYYFINETLVATIAGAGQHLPGASTCSLQMGGFRTGANANSGLLGQVKFSWNLWNSAISSPL